MIQKCSNVNTPRCRTRLTLSDKNTQEFFQKINLGVIRPKFKGILGNDDLQFNHFWTIFCAYLFSISAESQ